MKRFLLFSSLLCLTGCGLSENDTRSIKNMAYKGPNALCTQIETILVNPPPDMTAKQKKEAMLSRDVCRLPSDDITIDDAIAALDADTIAFDIKNNIITLYVLSAQDKHRVCCSLQTYLLKIGKTQTGNYFAGRYRLKDLNQARLQFFRPDFSGKPIFFKGSLSFVDIPFNKGELLGHYTEGVIDSTALNEKRKYQLYTPPGFKMGDNVPILMLGDGSSLGYYIRQWEPMILAGTVAPFVAIGINSGKRAVVDPQKQYDFDVRNADYIYNYSKGPQRFSNHLTFVIDELLTRVAAELGLTPRAGTTALAGGSSAGSFALWGVMKRPDIFGYSIGTSPSGPIPKDISALAATRHYYMSAGLYEPGFLTNAELYMSFLSQAGAHTDITTYPDGHSDDHKAMQMVAVLPKIFPPKE